MLQASQPADGSTRSKKGTYWRGRISQEEHLHTASQGTEELQRDDLDIFSNYPWYCEESAYCQFFPHWTPNSPGIVFGSLSYA